MPDPARRSASKTQQSAAAARSPAIASLHWHPCGDHRLRQWLCSGLQTACELSSARGGFIIVLRDAHEAELTAVHGIDAGEVFEQVFDHATAALQEALSGTQSTLGKDTAGERTIAIPLPLERGHGALCLLLPQTTMNPLAALDHEVLDALAAQTALLLATEQHRCALERLRTTLDISPDALQ